MSILAKTARFAAIALAGLFVGLSLVGIVGAWWISRAASDVALKGFGVIEIGVGVVDTGVGRVDNLVGTSRAEVRQAVETITNIGGQRPENNPVLSALNERLETSLAPRIAQMQQTLAPVRDAVTAMSNAVSLVSSLPMMAERAPRLAALDETFNRLEGLTADAAQLRGTLRALVVEQNSDVNPGTITALKALAQRIDTRLGEVQAKVQAVRAEVDALQVRLEKRKSRLLFVFNLLTLLSTLMLAWVVYAQVIVIQHHWALLRPREGAGKATPSCSTRRLMRGRGCVFEFQNLRRHTEPDGGLRAVTKCARLDRRSLHQTFVHAGNAKTDPIFAKQGRLHRRHPGELFCPLLCKSKNVTGANCHLR